MNKIIIALVFLGNALCAQEYLYPVGKIQDEGRTMVYLIHQRSPSHINLLIWNPVTYETSPGLLSTYTPASFTLLPDQSGFSFIDHGRVRIKNFNKRSPKAISFRYPIDDITKICWLSNETFYFSGRPGHRFGIFAANLQGDVIPLIHDTINDYLYPQRIGSELFCIKRTPQGTYSIITTHVSDINLTNRSSSLNEEEFHAAVLQMMYEDAEPVFAAPDLEDVFSDDTTALIFLTMVSEAEGFVIQHPRTIESDTHMIKFSYCHIIKNNNTWKNEQLFAFTLPAKFIRRGSDDLLYENILPLLPRVFGNDIFYAHCDDSDHCKTNLFSFDMTNHHSERRSLPISHELLDSASFSPLTVDPFVFYGGKISYAYDQPSGYGTTPTLWINERGILCAALPMINNALL
ncbi:hypothetical protein JW872_02680 [Candidatus Babeliales bacterium]|nr:hypothetical protein [Candidatus Babeliales bacterium]